MRPRSQWKSNYKSPELYSERLSWRRTSVLLSIMCSKCHQVFIKTTCFAKVNKSFLYSSKCFSWLSFTFNLNTQSVWWEHLSDNSLFSLGPAQLGRWGTPHASPESLQLSLGQPFWEGEKWNKKKHSCAYICRFLSGLVIKQCQISVFTAKLSMFITLGFYHVVISWLMCPVQKHSLSLPIRKLAF